MIERDEPVLKVETLHVDEEHSHAHIALRGLNQRTLNRRSTTLYHVIAGEGIMDVDGEEHELKPGVIIEVPPYTPYHDKGNVDMEAVSFPPFDLRDVEEVVDDDRILNDIDLLMKRGLVNMMFPDNAEDIDTGPERLRKAYGRSWQKVYGYLFGADANWVMQGTTKEQLEGFFSRLCDMEEQESMQPYIHLAFLGFWKKTGSDDMANALLFEGQPEDAYMDQSVILGLEKVYAEDNFDNSKHKLADFIINFAITMHFGRRFNPDNFHSREEIEEGFSQQLLGRYF